LSEKKLDKFFEKGIIIPLHRGRRRKPCGIILAEVLLQTHSNFSLPRGALFSEITALLKHFSKPVTPGQLGMRELIFEDGHSIQGRYLS
jgi:hypothetical protein